MTNLPPRLTFDTEELCQWLGKIALPPWRNHNGKLIGTKVDCAPIAEAISDWLREHGTIPMECELVEAPDGDGQRVKVADVIDALDEHLASLAGVYDAIRYAVEGAAKNTSVDRIEPAPNMADARYFDSDDLHEARMYPMSTCPRDPSTGDRLTYDVWIAKKDGTWEYRRAGACTRPQYDDERQGWTWGWVPEANLPTLPTTSEACSVECPDVEEVEVVLPAGACADPIPAPVQLYIDGPPPRALDSVPEQPTDPDPTPENLLYEAWGVIANAGGWPGCPDNPTPGWLGAAERWRDRWHAHLDGAAERRAAEKADQAMRDAVKAAIEDLLAAIDRLNGVNAWGGPFHQDVYAAADKLRGGTPPEPSAHDPLSEATFHFTRTWHSTRATPPVKGTEVWALTILDSHPDRPTWRLARREWGAHAGRIDWWMPAAVAQADLPPLPTYRGL